MNPVIYPKTLEMLKTETGSGKRLLDASCGNGLSSLGYRELGYAVTPTNYDPRSFRIKDMNCLQVDLNQPWPFEDHQFDVIVLQEVVEHLENIPFVFREVKRLLRPGGVFIFSTPNMLNWFSRLRYLATGFYRGRQKPLSVFKPPGNAPNWHILPFHVYHWICYHYGLKIEKVLSVRRGWPWHIFLVGLLFYPLSALYTYIWWVLIEKDARQRGYNRDLWRFLYSNELLLSNNMVIKVRKQP